MTRVQYTECDHCGTRVLDFSGLDLADLNGKHVADVCLRCAAEWLPRCGVLRETLIAVDRHGSAAEREA